MHVIHFCMLFILRMFYIINSLLESVMSVKENVLYLCFYVYIQSVDNYFLRPYDSSNK